MMTQSALFQSVVEALEKGEKRLKIGGLWGGAKAFLLAQLAEAHPGPFLVAAPTQERAEELYREILFFTGPKCRNSLGLYMAWDVFPYEPTSPRPDIVAGRMGVLHRLAAGEPLGVVAPVESLLQRILSPEAFRRATFRLQRGEHCPQEELLRRLEAGGYLFTGAVETYGQASVRGGIVDLFSPLSEHPVRLEFLGDAIESIRAFDPNTQKSVRTLTEVWVLPGGEPLSKASFRSADFQEYLSENTLCIFDEPQQAEQQVKRFVGEVEEAYTFSSAHKKGMPPPEQLYQRFDTVLEVRERLGYLDLESLVLGRDPQARRLSFEAQSPKTLGFGQREAFEKTADRIATLRHDHRILLTVRTDHQRHRVKRLLSEQDLPWQEVDRGGEPFGQQPSGSLPLAAYPLYLAVADLSEGFFFPADRLVVLTEEELFGKGLTRHRPKGAHPAQSLAPSVEDLKINDPVVHIHYGIGRYIGLQRLSIGGYASDFLALTYAGGDKVFVPLDSLQLVQKYIGPEGAIPRLDRLGGGRWRQTYQRIKGEVREMTQELLELYAQREVAVAHPFPSEGSMSEEFAAAFEYEETPDQLRAIEEVARDMEQDRPMDRLVCGDVGYGKTEVAIRAAFKAVMDGKQAAVVVPTTLLAQQHHQTFRRRFARFPVKVEVLSRFRPPREQRTVLKQMAQGEVDIVIGTHRLLQKDVQFHDLGLLIIDEEHRFGVAQKERLKRLRKEVHVLTLTATPIPRTLQISLAGMWDLSTIETPPADRLAIRTILAPFDRGILREAILRELYRGGQVFFVHNRVQNIEAVGRFLSELVPEAKIAVAHGQMRERQLEEVMLSFLNRKSDLLLTTTIIESGLDIPTANTIVVNNADRFGLAELYQLRGRVGRSGEQAYAYLIVREDAILTEEARSRLRAIQEFTELGSGFRIAARDLEIRGAGNLLGSQQSGHVAAVGFELYLQMIEEAARELKGEPAQPAIEPELHLPISAFIPETYVPESYQRLAVYRRLAALREEGDLALLREELADRYGPPPEEARRLLDVIGMKIRCRKQRVLRLHAGPGRLRVEVEPTVRFEEGKVGQLLTVFKGDIRFLSSHLFEIERDGRGWEDLSALIDRCLRVLSDAEFEEGGKINGMKTRRAPE